MVAYSRFRVGIALVLVGAILHMVRDPASGSGCWTKGDQSQNEEFDPGWDDTFFYGVEGEYRYAYSAPGGSSADRSASALIHIFDHDVFFMHSDDTQQHYSKGYKRESVGWSTQPCSAGPGEHDYPTDNLWTWSHDGDCTASGSLNANNWNISSGIAGVWFTASLKGSGESSLDAEVSQQAELAEGDSVNVSGTVSTGGGGVGISWTSSGADQTTVNACKSDSKGSTEAFQPGDFVKVRGVAGARAWIFWDAEMASITAQTSLSNWTVSLVQGGTSECICDGQNNRHQDHPMCP